MRRSLLAIVVLLIGSALPVLADGTETLGTPSIAIGAGTGIVAGGAGLQDAQPGIINVNVPGDVVQVLLYWGGAVTTNAASDDSVSVDDGGGAVGVTGTLIGGPTKFFSAFGKDFYYL